MRGWPKDLLSWTLLAESNAVLNHLGMLSQPGLGKREGQDAPFLFP